MRTSIWPVAAASLVAIGSVAAPGDVYRCTDPVKTSDQEIVDCKGKQTLRRNGVVTVVEPKTDAGERDRMEQQRRDQLAAEVAASARRDDRRLVAQFRDEAAHRTAREADLRPLQTAVRASQERLLALAKERKALDEKAAFHPNPATMPPALRRDLADNDGKQRGQNDALRTLQQQIEALNARYDQQLARLRTLWPDSTSFASASAPAGRK